ncbi:MAG: JAB domain-containing protein [Rhodopila sp.]
MVYLQDSKIAVHGAAQIAGVFRDLLALEDPIDQAKEHFYCLHLDIRSRVNLVELVSLGSQSSSIAHPRETFRRAVMQGSFSIIVGHNHPSGLVDPSEEDTRTTKRLTEAGALLGIVLVDHIIFAPGRFFSFMGNCAEDMTSDKPMRSTTLKGGEQRI